MTAADGLISITILCHLQHSLASPVENSNFLFKASPEVIALDLEVIAGLEIEPEPIARPEVACEAQCRVSANGPRAMHDLIDPSSGHTDILGEPVLRQAQGLEKVGGEDFAGMNGCELAMRHSSLSLRKLSVE